MMSDAIDDVLDSDEAEDETEDLTNQVILCFILNISLVLLFKLISNAD